MKFIDEKNIVPVKSWAEDVDSQALEQAANLANHPAVFGHVALMPDCHVGYGMPIGGVIGCKNSVIPNAVGVDIGCGMAAVRTDLPYPELGDKSEIRKLLETIKSRVPAGEAHAHQHPQKWEGFANYKHSIGETPGWLDDRAWELALKNLGTLGGGNHFIEIQKSEDGFIWLMIHTGSRNLGYRIASFYHKAAIEFDFRRNFQIPVKDLAFLPADSNEGRDYLRDMQFALEYAQENRNRIMDVFMESLANLFPQVNFTEKINIHHNYASLETHFNKELWVHRKGATSALKDQLGIIPGSMGSPSYIVKGLGNPESFKSCSHGAGRVMGRNEACQKLSLEECENAMRGIVFDRWSSFRGKGNRKGKSLWDLSEAPPAYKNIDKVIAAQLDLIEPVMKLHPLGVVKG